jgi:hypothetical protein
VSSRRVPLAKIPKWWITQGFWSQTTKIRAKEKKITPAQRIRPRCSLVRPITTTRTAATRMPSRQAGEGMAPGNKPEREPG